MLPVVFSHNAILRPQKDIINRPNYNEYDIPA